MVDAVPVVSVLSWLRASVPAARSFEPRCENQRAGFRARPDRASRTGEAGKRSGVNDSGWL